jgi:hypothetical protein
MIIARKHRRNTPKKDQYFSMNVVANQDSDPTFPT